MSKKEKTHKDHVLDLYNTFSNDDLERILFLAMDRIFIFNPNDNHCYNVDWISLNGNKIQITLKEEKKEE